MTEQDALDLELGRAVRELVEGQKPSPWNGPSWEARLTLRKHVLPEFGGYRCHNGDSPSDAHPTLDAAVSAARKGVRG